MSSTETQSILKRKAALGTTEQQARAMSVAKAMRLSVAKIGKELFQMPLSAIGAITEECKTSQLSDLANDEALICLLEGENGKVGAAAISPDIVGGLIQQQTMGRVGPPSGTSRVMTHTDAAMCVPLLDEIFKRVTPMLEGEEEQAFVEGFRFGARLEDLRAMTIALDRSEYFVVRLTLDIAGGARQGELTLILPKCEPEIIYGESTVDGADAPKAKGPQLNDVVMELPTELTMVLCKFKLSLSEVKQWDVGDALRLPYDAFPETDIMTETAVKIGSGTLGQVNGMRALRLKRKPNYANQPMRDEEDLQALDFPEIQGLPKTGHSSPDTVKKPGLDEFSIDVGADLPALKETLDAVDDTQTSISDPATDLLKEMPVDLNELPELDDFPDLAKLAQLSEAS